jgi:hypothetical protein
MALAVIVKGGLSTNTSLVEITILKLSNRQILKIDLNYLVLKKMLVQNY